MGKLKLQRSKGEMRRDNAAMRAVLTQVGLALGLRGKFGARDIITAARAAGRRAESAVPA